MTEIKAINLDEPILAKGLLCNNCNKLIDSKTTTTMLCNRCRRKYVAQKSAETMQAKYGVKNAMHIPGMANKIKEKMFEKYGTYCAMTNPSSRNKFEKTMQSKYGVSYFVNSPNFINKSSAKSKTNAHFAEQLKDANIAFTEERVLEDKRFDFKLEGSKCYIEIDPSYTHNSAGNHWDKDGLSPDNQIIKTLIAEKHGYRCIHVFDWDNKINIIKLISPKTPIYARKCKVSKIPTTTALQFSMINEFNVSPIDEEKAVAAGLWYNGKIVQIMMMQPDSRYGYEYELVKLCAECNTRVIGGASKLFKFMTEMLQTNSIVATCDNSKFTGQVFINIGMTMLKRIDPQVNWSKNTKRFKDSELETTSAELEVGEQNLDATKMIKNGWLPVYDCGQKVFVYGQCIRKPKSDSFSHSNIDYASILDSIEKSKEKLCEFCGQPFVPNSNFQRYCKRPHYMNCPVCNKQYLVTNNENLKRPPVACSYECRKVRREQTSMKKYGMKAPGNNPEARLKAKRTMQEKYGVDYAMQSEEIKHKSIKTMMDRYGVDNIQKIKEVSKASLETRTKRRADYIHAMIPMKLQTSNKEDPRFTLDESDISLYMLTNEASTAFLSSYGFKLDKSYSNIHLSLGLVKDGILYQVIRFEKSQKTDNIVLVDFGTRFGYFNPKGYAKLIHYATEFRGVEQFESSIPRNIADDLTIQSLRVELISRGDYEVYWIVEGDKLKKLTSWDNIPEMLQKYDYVTTDYIDYYHSISESL